MRSLIALGSVLGVVVLGVVGCNGPPPRTITAQGSLPVEWTDEQLAQPIAIQTLRSTPEASHHWVRARGAEKPHVHDRTDMTVFIVSGNVIMHIGARHVTAAPGDVIDIPRGTPHWVENVHPEASIAYAIFSPALDPGDRRFLD